jgi:hypothetical protein
MRRNNGNSYKVQQIKFGVRRGPYCIRCNGRIEARSRRDHPTICLTCGCLMVFTGETRGNIVVRAPTPDETRRFAVADIGAAIAEITIWRRRRSGRNV